MLTAAELMFPGALLKLEGSQMSGAVSLSILLLDALKELARLRHAFLRIL